MAWAFLPCGLFGNRRYHTFEIPVLLSPLFVSIALYAAPDLAQKYVAAVLITAGCFHGVACLWQFFIVYPELLADAEVLQLTKAQFLGSMKDALWV